MHARIRNGDLVMVFAGNERGKTVKVLRVQSENSRATVEHLNLVKRHTKARGQQQQGGIVEKEAALHLSNLMIMCEKCNAPVRMGKRHLEDGASVRVCRRCNEQLDR
jgi:large subunit ribosomal protein L24